MNLPLISIVIPVYNVEAYIEHCIHNILSQTYRNLEVIIVNDGSPDDSIKIAKELTKDDPRFIYIDKENGGQSDARNAGLDIATGDYIFFCDPDDFMFEKSIENLYYASQLTEADIVVGSFCRFEEGMFYFYPKPKYDELLSPLSARDAIQGMDSMEDYTLLRYSAVWGKLFKKHLFDEIRFPKGKYAEDQFIMWKLYLASEKMTRYDSDIYAYRINFKGLTQNYNLSHLDFIEAIEERIHTLMGMPELDYPMELALNQYKFALKRNLSMLEGKGFIKEEAELREKVEYADKGEYLFLKNIRE
ncbi:glycosyltransferase family 2 protein [Streptococcus mitis]|uniref:glycosyltransferase family 2 protein n=1 Tax=Streptococcus mitis TaxID=28037 RepID=UPI0015D66FE9|nr:glycosyltransferase family 2 protein [Streptococcus mitis]